MIKLEVKDKQEFETYILQNMQTGKKYSLIFEFLGDVTLEIGDEISLPKELTNRNYEGYSQPYCYEKTDKKLEDMIDIVQKKEFAMIKSHGKTIFLKRIYG